MTKYAKVYGDALYDLAVESKTEDVILSDLAKISAMLKEEAGYQKLLTSPAIENEEKKKLIEEAWKDSVNEYTLNFLRLLSDHSSLGEFSGCAEEFRARYNQDKKLIEVKVTSAVELSDKQREALKVAIEKKTGKKAVLIEKIDKNVLAGLKVSANGTEYDSTVANHLNGIARVLAGNN